jgi:hypothetical protein
VALERGKKKEEKGTKRFFQTEGVFQALREQKLAPGESKVCGF